ncbi:hypothetical protein B0H11DRAFT_1254356 [Mycena galericulata]|nr:hypothetical protein B0H11DRAFT_1254356 [Mycena galericulata]
MSTTTDLEARDTPSQFQAPPGSLSGADTSLNLDGPARPGPPTTISGGTSTSRTTDPTPADTPSCGALLRKRTKDSTQMGQESMRLSGSNDESDPSTLGPDDPAHSDPLNSTSGGPSTFRITGFSRDESDTITSDSPSTSTTTGISRDPAPAAAPPRAQLLRRSTRETEMGEGHTRDDLASGSHDDSGVSTPRLDDFGPSDPLATTFAGSSTCHDPAPVETSSPGAVLQRSPRDSMQANTGLGEADQANEVRELSRNLMFLSHRIETLETKIADAGQSERRQVKITPWRMLNTIFVLVVGGYKAVATYRGQATGPTTADWIIGVVWALTYVCLYKSDTDLWNNRKRLLGHFL